MKKIGKHIWYSLVTLGLLDFTVQMLTGRQVRIIHSILAFFFGER